MSATTSTATRRLGDVDVFPIGLGGMPLSVSGRPDEAQAIRTIHAALDAGITLIDTADAYAGDESEVGHNERLIAKALDGRRDGVVVATKGGHTRRGTSWGLDGSPGPPPRGLRGLAARAGDRSDRPLPVPPPGSRGPLRGLGRGAQGAPGRGQGPLGRALERHRRPARRGAGDRRRRLRAEPARARLPLALAEGRGAGGDERASRSCPGRRWAASARPTRRRRATP